MSNPLDGLATHVARADHAASRGGVAIVNGVRYTLTYDGQVPGYVVTDPEGDHVMTIIGRKITEVKQYLREYLSD